MNGHVFDSKHIVSVSAQVPVLQAASRLSSQSVKNLYQVEEQPGLKIRRCW